MSVLALLALAATAATLPDPIAPASEGQMQCYAPDLARKTCASLSSYALGADGGIINDALVLISKSPKITMETTAPVTIKDGRVCGALQPQDLEAAKFVYDDAPPDESRLADLKLAVKQAYGPIMGREICTAYVQDGGRLTARITQDGLPNPGLDERVKWVSPADGYRVSP
jgi:hypothetical protein